MSLLVTQQGVEATWKWDSVALVWPEAPGSVIEAGSHDQQSDFKSPAGAHLSDTRSSHRHLSIS